MKYKKYMKTYFNFISLIILLLPLAMAHGKIHRSKMKKLVIPQGVETTDLTQKEMLKIVPFKNLSPLDKPDVVLGKIADGGVNYWFNNTEAKNSFLKKSVDQVQEKMKTDVVIKGESKTKVDHKISFKLEAFQALAKVEYIGWLKANLIYNMNESKSVFELREKVFRNKDLILSHTANQKESAAAIGIGWNW